MLLPAAGLGTDAGLGSPWRLGRIDNGFCGTGYAGGDSAAGTSCLDVLQGLGRRFFRRASAVGWVLRMSAGVSQARRSWVMP